VTGKAGNAPTGAAWCCRCALFLIALVWIDPAFPEVIPGPAAKRSTYLEAISVINRYAIFINPRARGREIVNKSIKGYLQEKDPYSDYLTPEEYANFKRTRKGGYAGLGAEIERGPGGSVICYPEPGSPAERAGMVAGDRLEQVDGAAVAGKSLYTVAAMTRGRAGTRVALRVRSPGKEPRELTVTRAKGQGRTVSVQKPGGLTVLRVTAFAPETPLELKRALGKTAGGKPVVIDLRGNRGGDLMAAIETAELFLPKGRTVCVISMRSGAKSYRARGDGVVSPAPLYLWQDAATASAAEVFIAALTQNGRAASIGARSYGKGSRQDVIPLSDGSALVLTTGYLQTPSGGIFNARGLEPGFPLPEKAAATAEYTRRTRELIERKR
jgi:carboxyl-terminal processing protease